MVLVAKQVKRWPSMPVIRSCAPGRGRSLRMITRGPAAQVQHPGDLRDLRAVTDVAVAVIGRAPRLGWDPGDRVLHAGSDGEPDRMLQAA